MAVAERDLARALAMYEEAARLFRELGQPIREGIALSNLALAARLVGATETAFAGLGGAVPEGVHLAFARIFRRSGEELGPQVDAGRALSVDGALAEARHLFAKE